MKFLPIFTWFCCMLLSLPLFAQDQRVEDLWNMYARGALDSALTGAMPLVRQSPDDIPLNLLVGRVLTDEAKFGDASPYLHKVVKLSDHSGWQSAWALDYLGDCFYAAGRYDSASSAFSDCLALNATATVNRKASFDMKLLGFHPLYKDWKTVESKHFLFHFPPETAVRDVDSYIAHTESGFDTINAFFNSTLPKKIDFFVWNNNEEAQKAGLGQLAFAQPQYCVVHTSLGHTVGHEMTHVVSYYAVPHQIRTGFISEGIGVCFNLNNDDKLSAARQYLKDYSINDTIPIEYFWKDWRL
ncbi:MAG TPA: tetratricopeptide repeat protein, partial [Candidatus Kapabacteria bacterium]|nr:tetratricopeptide repeat protein [Candidatus Kapabacteria bacterium]